MYSKEYKKKKNNNLLFFFDVHSQGFEPWTH